jgi:hypothetical protein
MSFGSLSSVIVSTSVICGISASIAFAMSVAFLAGATVEVTAWVVIGLVLGDDVDDELAVLSEPQPESTTTAVSTTAAIARIVRTVSEHLDLDDLVLRCGQRRIASRLGAIGTVTYW